MFKMKKLLTAMVMTLTLLTLTPITTEAGIFGDMIDYVKEVANDEVYICEREFEGRTAQWYMVPSTKTKTEYGMLFWKDEGYSIKAIIKDGEEVLGDDIFEFLKTDKGWQWTSSIVTKYLGQDGQKKWFSVNQALPPAVGWNRDGAFVSAIFNIGKELFEASNHFPNMK